MYWIAFATLVLSAAAIFYQDLKARLISLWLILLFGISNVAFYLSTYPPVLLFENILFCVCYLLFSYGILLLYFYIKHKKFDKVINTQFGMGDVLIMLFIGMALEPVTLIYFFSGALIVSLLLSVLFFRKHKNIPLAGMLVLVYLAWCVFQAMDQNL